MVTLPPAHSRERVSYLNPFHMELRIDVGIRNRCGVWFVKGEFKKGVFVDQYVPLIAEKKEHINQKLDKSEVTMQIITRLPVPVLSKPL